MVHATFMYVALAFKNLFASGWHCISLRDIKTGGRKMFLFPKKVRLISSYRKELDIGWSTSEHRRGKL